MPQSSRIWNHLPIIKALMTNSFYKNSLVWDPEAGRDLKHCAAHLLLDPLCHALSLRRPGLPKQPLLPRHTYVDLKLSESSIAQAVPQSPSDMHRCWPCALMPWAWVTFPSIEEQNCQCLWSPCAFSTFSLGIGKCECSLSVPSLRSVLSSRG